MNHRELHDQMVALNQQLQTMRANLVRERGAFLDYATTVAFAIEEVDHQMFTLHESMRELDDEQLDRRSPCPKSTI